MTVIYNNYIILKYTYIVYNRYYIILYIIINVKWMIYFGNKIRSCQKNKCKTMSLKNWLYKFGD